MSIWESANPRLRDLVAYEPGRPIEDVARDLGLDPASIVKLASNENPLGPSPQAVEAMRRAVEKVHLYPDGGGWALRTAIADRFGFSMGNVVLGNGSNEIIELVGHAFLAPGDEIIVSDHAFVVYKLMATLFGADTIEVPESPPFHHDLDAMAEAITPRTKEIFVANPNNPTGTLVDQVAIDRFMARVPERVVVIFDEAYHEFLDDPPDTVKFVREGRNVVVLRTFSKIQGLAGTRVGYGLAPEPLAEILQKARQPFNVNAVAQAGALAGLRDTGHQERTKRLTDEGRQFLEESFARMGLEFVPSFANFVLVRVGEGDALFRAMLREGVIVRAMSGYKLPDWIRISVGTMEENRRCLDVLSKCLEARASASPA